MWKMQTSKFGCTVPWTKVPTNESSNICHPSRINGTIEQLLDRLKSLSCELIKLEYNVPTATKG